MVLGMIRLDRKLLLTNHTQTPSAQIRFRKPHKHMTKETLTLMEEKHEKKNVAFNFVSLSKINVFKNNQRITIFVVSNGYHTQ